MKENGGHTIFADIGDEADPGLRFSIDACHAVRVGVAL